MDAKQLAQNARLQVNRDYMSTLNKEVCRRLELAYVAAWLDAQDELILSRAAVTACEAMALLHAVERA